MDPDPAIFVIDLQDAVCLLLLKATFTSFFKDKKSKRNHKTVGIRNQGSADPYPHNWLTDPALLVSCLQHVICQKRSLLISFFYLFAFTC
jgi:hypothetical protein